MKCCILHESNGRLRVHMMQPRMTLHEADILEYYLKGIEGIQDVCVNDRTQNVIVMYASERQTVLDALSVFHYTEQEKVVPAQTGRELNREFEDKILYHTLRRFLSRFFLPFPVRAVLTFAKSYKYILPGIQALLKGKLEVSVLDATTVAVSLLRGDFDTAGDLMFLLGLSEILEDFTHKKSVDDLARSMSLNVDQAWLVEGDQDVLVPVSQVKKGDRLRLRTSNILPLDGVVVEGNASINQSSLTGESLPVRKEAGNPVYAGTVIEEGEIVIRVSSESGNGRYDRIVSMIEESEKLKSDSENRALRIADSLVPYSLGATLATLAITRNVTRALAVLMVDFSCALKLSIPISMLSAMRQASTYGIMVKGGKFLESCARADRILFDKTGTLTCSTPKVKQVIPFGNHDENEMLRLAACLEEHYPHSIANAVVLEASNRHLLHEERHSKVEYVVAHGIVSSIDGERVLIGSYHFLFEDEHCRIPEGEKERFDALPDEYSHLYLGIANELAAVILIEDPIRQEAYTTVRDLKDSGLHVVMLTGDSDRTAKAVASRLGITEYQSEVLPEDKASYVQKCKDAGETVIMVGDGINDTPALSLADTAVAISNGAEIAREIADVTIPEKNIYNLVVLRDISTQVQKRVENNYRFIIGFNFSLIVLGILGVLPPSVTAYMHNFSTLGLSLHSMSNLKIGRKEI